MEQGLRECNIRHESDHSLLCDRITGEVYARGNHEELYQLASGRFAITEAPLLAEVEEIGCTLSGHREFRQLVNETKWFRGRLFQAGIDEWTSGVVYPDSLGIAFTERLADLPLFVRGVEHLIQETISVVLGTASTAGAGDPPLLGDWIRNGEFERDRLIRRFESVLGGRWAIVVKLKIAVDPSSGHMVHIERLPG